MGRRIHVGQVTDSSRAESVSIGRGSEVSVKEGVAGKLQTKVPPYYYFFIFFFLPACVFILRKDSDQGQR